MSDEMRNIPENERKMHTHRPGIQLVVRVGVIFRTARISMSCTCDV